MPAKPLMLPRRLLAAAPTGARAFGRRTGAKAHLPPAPKRRQQPAPRRRDPPQAVARVVASAPAPPAPPPSPLDETLAALAGPPRGGATSSPGARRAYRAAAYEAARKAWDAAARVAGSLNNPYGICDCVEQIGVARLAQNRTHEAVHIWEKALELIGEHPYGFREAAILERMVELARQQGWSDHERAWAQRLAVAELNREQQGGAH